MKTVRVPIKTAIKIIGEETESKLKAFREESAFFRFDQEASRVFSAHLEAISKIENLDQLNFFLVHFRGVNLDDWAKTL